MFQKISKTSTTRRFKIVRDCVVVDVVAVVVVVALETVKPISFRLTQKRFSKIVIGF